jgi:hypothetical protein
MKEGRKGTLIRRSHRPGIFPAIKFTQSSRTPPSCVRFTEEKIEAQKGYPRIGRASA